MGSQIQLAYYDAVYRVTKAAFRPVADAIVDSIESLTDKKRSVPTADALLGVRIGMGLNRIGQFFSRGVGRLA